MPSWNCGSVGRGKVTTRAPKSVVALDDEPETAAAPIPVETPRTEPADDPLVLGDRVVPQGKEGGHE